MNDEEKRIINNGIADSKIALNEDVVAIPAFLQQPLADINETINNLESYTNVVARQLAHERKHLWETIKQHLPETDDWVCQYRAKENIIVKMYPEKKGGP